MTHYKFTDVTCASGAIKDFECDAANFQEARALLLEFIQNN